MLSRSLEEAGLPLGEFLHETLQRTIYPGCGIARTSLRQLNMVLSQILRPSPRNAAARFAPRMP
jgi:hypothetical protein